MATDERRAHESRDAGGLFVNDTVTIPLRELQVRATRSGGPGGQHVNTSSTRVEIVWNARRSAALDTAQRAHLLGAVSSRLDSLGRVRVVASDTRSQRRNRELAEHRLADLVRKGLKVRKPRKGTRPHRTAVERRLAEKKLHSTRKRERRIPPDD
ncbi:MAG TPA: alternative ribosome rescue aminoacyl-tRNA hydrolase ArfB [Gemmatimonadaceae bacterium]|nr:alternative ribosome rescue aminoacyl-tRNA hydrolase ArfB [Gemmatimonadaceae bacterium]